MGEIEAAAVEFIDVGIIYLPGDIAVGVICSVADTFAAGSCYCAKTASVNVTFGIVIVVVSIGTI